MKWRNKLKKQKPKEGDLREHLKFAWLPTRCEDGYTHWFGWIIVQSRYSYVKCVDLFGYIYDWKIIRNIGEGRFE